MVDAGKPRVSDTPSHAVLLFGGWRNNQSNRATPLGVVVPTMPRIGQGGLTATSTASVIYRVRRALGSATGTACGTESSPNTRRTGTLWIHIILRIGRKNRSKKDRERNRHPLTCCFHLVFFPARIPTALLVDGCVKLSVPPDFGSYPTAVRMDSIIGPMMLVEHFMGQKRLVCHVGMAYQWGSGAR